MNLFTRKAASVAAFTVLGVTAGGIAWAESSTAPVTSAASSSGSNADVSPVAAGDSGSATRLRGLGKRVLHGEVVLQTRKGIVTADIARGTVSAIDGDSISVHSADGVTTTFTIDAKTKARSAGQVIPIGDVHQGDKVAVLGVKTGSAAPTARLVRKLPADTTTNG